VLTLLANTARAQLQPRHVLAVLAHAVRHARSLAGPRGDASEAAASIIEWASGNLSRRT
jgi:hypothetical protein